MHLKTPQSHEPLLCVLKLPGDSCNVNCHYCYEKRKPYEARPMLAPDLLEHLVGLCGDRPLTVLLHGGEPLLVGRSRMRRLLDVLRRAPNHVTLAIQTNGALLDEEWLDFLEAEWPDIDLGISLDGDAAGNAHRVDYAERPIYPRIMEALDLVHRRGRTVGVIAVVTARLLGRAPETVAFLGGLPMVGAVKLSPCLDFSVRTRTFRSANARRIATLNPDGQAVPGWATTPDQYADFLVAAFDAWVDGGAFRHITLEPFVSIIRRLEGRPSSFTHFSDRKEPYIVTLYPDGRLGSSDEFDMPASILAEDVRDLPDPAAFDRALAFEGNERLAAQISSLLHECGSCPEEAVCQGGSLADRLRYGDSEVGAQYCTSRRRVIDHVRSRIEVAV